MLRLVLFAGSGFVFALMGTAQAQTYSVDPGQWEWQADGILAGTPMPFEGRECLSASEARIDVDQALSQAGLGDCTYEQGAVVGKRTDFVLSCTEGEIVFTANGTVTVDRRKVTLKADGFIVMEGLGDVPAFVQATASHKGQCTAP